LIIDAPSAEICDHVKIAGAGVRVLREAAEKRRIDVEKSDQVVEVDFEVVGAEEILQLSVLHRVVRVAVMHAQLVRVETWKNNNYFQGSHWSFLN